MAINVAEVNEIIWRVRKANECVAEGKRARPPALLFDEFWREGELALLFGAVGTGKSVLAVQVADALSRGTPLRGFDMPRRWQKVLYVDLRLSDAQFFARYGMHKFAENLYRERPGGECDPFDWIKAAVAADGFRVVVIDDITAIKRTWDGVRESLLLMRNLKQLCRDKDVSILVLSGSEPPSDGWESENDLKRSRIMCSVADSVFSLGRKRMPEGARRLMQTRTSGAELVWNHKNAPEGNIKKLETGMLGFEFDVRFSEAIDDHLRELIMCVDEMRERGETYRKIEEVCGISKSYAHALHKKWGPLARRLREDHPRYCRKEVRSEKPEIRIEEEEWQEAEFEKPIWLEEEKVTDGQRPVESEKCTEIQNPKSEIQNRPRSIYDLEVGWDGYGRTIYVESRTNAGTPTVWYQIDSQGTTRRFKRGTFDVQVEHLNSGPFL